MNLLKTIKTLVWRRAFWAGLFFIMFVFNGLLLLTYVSNNRNALVYNPFVKSALPFYRGIREITNSIIDTAFIFKMRRDIGISQYRLEVKTSDLRKLNEAIPSSLSDEVISGALLFTEDMEETVKGVFYYQDKAYDVKVRYRGENANHWTRAKKSWQIKFDKDTPFNGLRTLKLIIPSDREYFAEALNNYRAKKLGLIVPDAEFVQLYVNNDYYGVYFAIEDFSSEFLEKSNKPADANIYASEDSQAIDSQATIFDSSNFWRKEAEDKLFDFENFSELDFLLSQMGRPDFVDIAPDIIDMESFYNWNIVSILAGSGHQSNFGNMRLYFNSAKGKFEFLSWDVGIKSYLPFDITNELTKKILSNPEYYKERNQHLWNYVSDDKNLNDDLAYYHGLYQKLKGGFYSDFKKHDSNIGFNNRVAYDRDRYVALFNQIKGLFSNDEIDLNIQHNASQKLVTLSFDINSFAGVTLEDVILPDGAQLTSSIGQYLFNNTEVVNLNYFGTIEDISKIKINLVNAITKEPVEINSIQLSDVSTFAHFDEISQTVDDFISMYPQFKKSENNIILSAGTYVFNQDVVAPKNTLVRIMPGTTVYFAPGASFVSYSPVQAKGTSSQPITFRRLNPDEPWGSFGILNNNDNKSLLEYVNIDGGGSDYINGVFLSGMASIYYSDVAISNSSFSGSASDDGLNVKYGNVTASGNIFKENSADGFDLDYASGEISNNMFLDNGNDGIDLSGSSVLIKNNKIERSGDKCISIGERTINTVVFNNILDNCHIGVEVKDGSITPIINSIIKNNDIGVNAYMKKAIYLTGGTANVYNSVFENNQTQTQKDENSEIQDHSAGDTSVLKQYLDIDANQAPAGLWESF